MNKLPRTLVIPPVRFLLTLLGPLTLLLLASSCSPSRVVDSDRFYEAGVHKTGSIINSDIFLERGAALDAAYVADSRIFLSEGSSLTGLRRGVRDSSVYHEIGSFYPRHRNLHGRLVDDADQAYRDRHLNHLPIGPVNQGRGGAAVGSTVFVGGGFGFFGPRFVHPHLLHHRRGNFAGGAPSRSVSVRPASYRSRN